MDLRDRHVIVSAIALADHLDLVERVARQLDGVEADALRGSLAELRISAVLEPAFA